VPFTRLVAAAIVVPHAANGVKAAARPHHLTEPDANRTDGENGRLAKQARESAASATKIRKSWKSER
jgi:hypothetical protein